MYLPSVLGNARLSGALKPHSALTLSSPVLLCGDSGSGKKTAARDIAAALLCSAGSAAPCGSCPSCIRMRAGSHQDFELFNPEGLDIKVDDIRELKRRTFVQAGESDRRVVVINAAERMNAQSQNALLKVLEESNTTFFILLCKSSKSLLQTIISRSVVFQTAPISQNIILEALSLTHGDTLLSERERAAAACGGSLGQAINILNSERPVADQIAERFVASLKKGELKIMECCFEAGALSREDYGSFCDSACVYISAVVAAHDCRSADGIAAYDFLSNQRDKLSLNPSVLALGGALAAFCAHLHV